MPLVFIHGVATRRGGTPAEQTAFDQHVRVRDGFFRTIAFADQVSAGNLHIENPYWGDLASRFAWNLTSVPQGGDEAFGFAGAFAAAAFGSEPNRLAQVALATTTEKAAATLQQPNTVLLTLARQASLAHAVDAVFAAAANVKPAAAAAAPDADLAALAAKAVAYTEANPNPAWLKTVNNDSAFLDTLSVEVAKAPEGAVAVETFGFNDVVNRLKDAAARLGNAAKGVISGMADAAGNLIGDVTRPMLMKARPAITSLVGRFFGDVFVYIQTRGIQVAPGPIVKEVIGKIDTAIAAKKPGDDKLYIIAHSMGGEIVYDILTFFRPDIHCDLLVTVGSQIGFFEEMKLLKTSNPAVAATSNPNRVPPPANVDHWLNVFDLTDIFGFTERGIFDGVENFEFDTDTLPILSHTTYFDRPRFHERLRARINTALKG